MCERQGIESLQVEKISYAPTPLKQTCMVDKKMSMKPIMTMVKSRKFHVFWWTAKILPRYLTFDMHILSKVLIHSSCLKCFVADAGCTRAGFPVDILHLPGTMSHLSTKKNLIRLNFHFLSPLFVQSLLAPPIPVQ